MHELSVVNHVIEIASDHARRAGATKVSRVSLRIGALSCVHPDALESCFQVACEGTLLAGAELSIEELPVAIYCSRCSKLWELPNVTDLRCPNCGHPSGDIRQGNELEVQSIEVLDPTSN